MDVLTTNSCTDRQTDRQTHTRSAALDDCFQKIYSSLTKAQKVLIFCLFPSHSPLSDNHSINTHTHLNAVLRVERETRLIYDTVTHF